LECKYIKSISNNPNQI